MKIDQHFYVTAVLLRAAGFPEAEALQVAHADQYTDDAVASQPTAAPGSSHLVFDPVRTAHIGLESLLWRTQKLVYVPFHFLPPTPIRREAHSWLVRANGGWAWGLLQDALGNRHKNRLAALGIALHTFQDQWSHDGFSGRQHEENNVQSAYDRDGDPDGWEPIWDFPFSNLAPPIGHAEVLTLPDQAHRDWRIVFKNGRSLARNNQSQFLDCHEETYKVLRRTHGGTYASWVDLRPRLEYLLGRESLPSDYQRAFQDFFPAMGLRSYNPGRWREPALRVPYPREFYDSLFYGWHRAAFDQRCAVLRNLL